MTREQKEVILIDLFKLMLKDLPETDLDFLAMNIADLLVPVDKKGETIH